MSFSKAKLTRFNEMPVGSGPGCIYDPKLDTKLPGGIIDKKVPRFIEKVEGTPGGSIKSETESVRSCKSAQLFRTPNIRRHLRRLTSNRIKPKIQKSPIPSCDDATKELLWANSVEIRNKDETIAEQEKLIEEQKEQILSHQKEIDILSTTQNSLQKDLETMKETAELEYEECELVFNNFKLVFNLNNINEMKTLSDKLKLISTNLNLYVKEQTELMMKLDGDLKLTKQKLENTEEELFKSMEEYLSLKVSLIETEKSLKKLNEDLQFDFLTEKKQHDDDLNIVKHDAALKIEYLNEVHDMKIKELESCREIEKRQIIKEYTEKLNAMEKDLRSEINLVQQTAIEKVQLAELTAEEKCMILKNEMEKEKSKWESEFDKCQKIAETEIMQSEFEKIDLQKLVNAKTSELENERAEKLELQKNLMEKNGELIDLMRSLNKIVEEHGKYREKSDADLKEAQEDCKKICNEQFKYQITLNAMRGTVDILSKRLQNSDNDVERLKEELAALSKLKMESENSNMNYRSEIAVLQGRLIEYKVMLTNLTASSKLLLEQNNILQQNEEFLNIIDQVELDTEDKIRIVNKELIDKIDLLKLEAKTEKQTLISENENYKMQLDESKQQLEDIYATLKVIDKVLSKLETGVEERDDKIQERDEQILKLQIDIQDYLEQIKTLRNENHFMRDNIESYDVILRGKDVIMDNLECELSDLREEFNDYQENMDEKLQELEEVECASARRENELQNKVEEQKLRITDLEAQVEEAMALIGPFRAQLEGYELERQALENQRDEAADDARKISMRCAELLGHQNHKQKIKYVMKLREDLTKTLQENKLLHLQLLRHKATIEVLQKQIPNPSNGFSVVSPKLGAKLSITPQRPAKPGPSQDVENLSSPKFTPKNKDQRVRTVLGVSPVTNKRSE